MRILFFSLLFLSTLSCQLVAQSHEQINKAFLVQLNDIRSKGCRCGNKFYPLVQTLRLNKTLKTSAYIKAKDMVVRRYFNHLDPHGRGVEEGVEELGYNWTTVAENIGKGQISLSQILEDWLKSPIHCRTMMNPNIKEIGLGRYKNHWALHMGSVDY